MIRATSDKGIRVYKQIKYNQNMYIATLSQYTHSSPESHFLDNAIESNLLHLKNGPLIQPIVSHQHNRQFTRSSILLHDIKCVTSSYYEDLGLESTATSKEIKEAFYRLSKECHPDKVGEDNTEALLQFQAISEAYDTLSDPRLRRQYDRGVLGRASSAADRDASKHKVEGDAFIQGRAAFREQYGEGYKRLSRKQMLDGYVTETTSKTFRKSLYERNAESMAQPNTIDEQGRSIIQGNRPNRLSRSSTVGPSYAEWTSGKNENGDEKKGGRVIVIVFLVILIIIVRKLT